MILVCFVFRAELAKEAVAAKLRADTVAQELATARAEISRLSMVNTYIYK